MTLAAALVAALGPTNTGKTHLAIERMCRHESGAIGFPLRLLAREAYERVVRIKGAAQVALLTGEEQIIPARARYFLCTAESLPLTRAFAFVGLDEAQMAADPARGHVFTNILLHVRGTQETLVLGAETLRPLIERLLPDATIETRTRLSTLRATPPVKLSRLPRRSAVVAFTAEDVYAIAEILRRRKGGAAIVMGNLSPRTRNAQVALYQSGEVDYLVATDAIGMGLNLDISHVAFAALGKFDGQRHRRLRSAEMAQIAGRAGRYRQDGTFSTLAMKGEESLPPPVFLPEEIAAIEQHTFPPLRYLWWRNHRLDYRSLGRLIESLEESPRSPLSRRSADADDLLALYKLAEQPWIRERAQGRPALMRLWAACSLPNYRQTGPDAHATLVARIYRHLSEGPGTIPDTWIAAELSTLDNVSGNIAALSWRIAATRTWTYASHQPDWLSQPKKWVERARAVEDRLSDALHARLRERFVSRRTAILLDGRKASANLPVSVEKDGAVLVAGEEIGTLTGFVFRPDPAARHDEKRLLIAAGKRQLAAHLERRAKALAAAADDAFSLDDTLRQAPSILWQGNAVATLTRGSTPLNPHIHLVPDVAALAAAPEVHVRLDQWLAAERNRKLRTFRKLQDMHPRLSPAARGLVYQLEQALGVLERQKARELLDALTPDDRRRLRTAGVTLGSRHVFAASLLKPAPTALRIALSRAAQKAPPPSFHPGGGQTSISLPEDTPHALATVAGYWPVGDFGVRVDIAERIAHALHEADRKARHGKGAKPKGFPVPDGVQTIAGLSNDRFALLIEQLGFRPLPGDPARLARVHNRPPARKQSPHRKAASPFVALGPLLEGAD